MNEAQLSASMLAALAAARKDPGIRMKRNDVEAGRDICVLVDEKGDFADKDGIDPQDPRTWPCVIMLFGSAQAEARKRIADGEDPWLVSKTRSKFYSWDPFDRGEEPMSLVGDDIPVGYRLVKVAERLR